MKSNIANPCNYLAGAVLLAFRAALPARADNYQTAVLSQNPVGYWRLDETAAPSPPGSMVAADSGSLGTAANGVPTDVVQGAPGAIVSDSPNLSCLMPGAADNRVRIPYAPQWNSSGPFSVEFWAKPDDLVDTICRRPRSSSLPMPLPCATAGSFIR